MNNLQFIFSNNNETVYDFRTDYTYEDGYVVFSWEEVLYKIKVDDGFEFRRITKDEEFVLLGNGTSTITLRDLDKTFDIPVNKFEHTKGGKKHTVKYALASDEESSKTIILNFGS